MATERSADTFVEAPLDACLEVILDMEAYPRWVKAYRRVRVEETDDRGRPAIVAYAVGGMGMTAHYRLAYSYADDPLTVAFEQVDGDLTRGIDGHYELTPRDGGTHVRYTARVDVAVPVPGLMRRTAERIVMETALRGLAGEVSRRAASPGS